ncbi:MAG: enzyme with glycosyltransferase and SAM-binding domain [Myxococcales bacterium]|nr:enzyme with glycosyltransferase and SAM-binding domain [Myxococcales bacterium]
MSSGTSPLKYVVEEINYAVAHNTGRPRTILDVGCGIGLNGKHGKERGAYVVGLEIVPSSIERAKLLLDEVKSANIETDEVLEALKGRTFDLIMFGDVLEHTVDPLGVLRRLSTLLADGGHVIVSLPNIAAWPVRFNLLAGKFAYEQSGILDDTHLRFFTKATATRLVTDAGLEVMRHDLNPMIVRGAKSLIRKRLLESQNGEVDPTKLMKSPLYQAYQKYFRPIEGLLAKAAPGLLAFQHVIVARKPPKLGKLAMTIGIVTDGDDENIEALTDEVREYAPDAKIIVVDSSSSAMERLMYAAAADSDALIYLDRTYPARMIPRIRQLLEQGADVVNATRPVERENLRNRVAAKAAWAVHGLPTSDVHSGMRGYRASVIRAFDFSGAGDALPLDTLILPSKSNYKVVEIPVEVRDTGTTKHRLRDAAWTVIRIASAIGQGKRVRRGRNYQQRR